MTRVKLVRLVVSGHAGVLSADEIITSQVKDQKQLISLVVKNLTSADQNIAKSYFERITQKNLIENIEGDLNNDMCLLSLDEENYVMILQNQAADTLESNFAALHDSFVEELYELN